MAMRTGGDSGIRIWTVPAAEVESGDVLADRKGQPYAVVARVDDKPNLDGEIVLHLTTGSVYGGTEMAVLPTTPIRVAN